MKSGLLWYSAGQSIPDALAAGARKYFDRFGIYPNRAFVNPAQLPNALPSAPPAEGQPALLVMAMPTVLLNHVWLGIDKALPTVAPPTINCTAETTAIQEEIPF